MRRDKLFTPKSKEKMKMEEQPEYVIDSVVGVDAKAAEPPQVELPKVDDERLKKLRLLVLNRVTKAANVILDEIGAEVQPEESLLALVFLAIDLRTTASAVIYNALNVELSEDERAVLLTNRSAFDSWKTVHEAATRARAVSPEAKDSHAYQTMMSLVVKANEQMNSLRIDVNGDDAEAAGDTVLKEEILEEWNRDLTEKNAEA